MDTDLLDFVVEETLQIVFYISSLPIVSCKTLIGDFFINDAHVFKGITVVVEHAVLPRKILGNSQANHLIRPIALPFGAERNCKIKPRIAFAVSVYGVSPDGIFAKMAYNVQSCA